MNLVHTPSQILRQLLIDLGYASTSGDWVAYATMLPDGEGVVDKAIGVIDTAGTLNGKLLVTGEVQETMGLQLLVRAADPQAAWAKCNEIKSGLSTVHLSSVSVLDSEDYGTATQSYVIYNISVRSGPLPVTDPDSDRKVYSLNLLASIAQQ